MKRSTLATFAADLLASYRWRFALVLLATAVLGGCQKPAQQTAAPGAPEAKPAAPAESAATAPTGPALTAAPETQAPPAAAAKPSAASIAAAREALSAMVAAYQAAKSYSDDGTVVLKGKVGGRDVHEQMPFSVSLLRPNQLRLEVYQAKVACDGKNFKAFIEAVPNQFLVRPAPARLGMEEVHSDRLLTEAISRGVAMAAPQVMLLLAEKPMDILLFQADDPVMLDSTEVEGQKCDRVGVPRKEGQTVYVIDRQSHLLRRIEYATEELRRIISAQESVQSLALTAELAAARFEPAPDPKRFQLDQPPGSEVVSVLLPPHPGQLLGKKAPEFEFANLEGKPESAQSLAGKVILLDFWATWCGPCRSSLPLLEKVYQKYKDNPKVVFRAVSVDTPDVDAKDLLDAVAALKVNIPVLRDKNDQTARLFLSTSLPTTFLIGANGLVQDYERGFNPDVETALPEKLDKLLEGKDIFEERRKEYQEEIGKWQAAASRSPDAEPPQEPTTKEQEIPKAQIAPRSQPSALKMKSLWKCGDLKAPGNFLVVPQSGKPPRLFVLDGWQTVAELSPDGKVLASHPLSVPSPEAVCFLRTGTAGGKRYFVGSAVAQQQVHLFDEDWKLLLNFPADALENKHAGIGDVQLVNFAGDGELLMCVSYWGTVGVQGVSLQGERVWSHRALEMVLRLAATAPDASGKRNIICVNNRGTLVYLDGKGERKAEFPVAGRLVHQIVAADLAHDGHPLLCGLAATEIGVNVALGLDAEGKELWQYPLPKGVHEQPIEPIAAGRLQAKGPGQWLLPAADGSIHILSADGKPLDKFFYGAPLCGLATWEIGGRPALLVASPQGVEALQVE